MGWACLSLPELGPAAREHSPFLILDYNDQTTIVGQAGQSDEMNVLLQNRLFDFQMIKVNLESTRPRVSEDATANPNKNIKVENKYFPC